MSVEDLSPWLNRVKAAGSRKDIYAILEEFRKVPFTDEQCSTMSKLYVRLLERLKDTSEPDNIAPAAAVEEDGPVWYEKM